jgi:hypothetical protein
VIDELPRWADDPAAYNRAWIKRKRKKNPAFARREAVSARRWQLENPIRNARNQYKQAARRKSRVWDLADEMFDALVIAPCGYCGASPESPGINGIDRIDSDGGYTPGNVVTACALCNYAKRNRSVGDFLAWAKRIADYQEARNGDI